MSMKLLILAFLLLPLFSCGPGSPSITDIFFPPPAPDKAPVVPFAPSPQVGNSQNPTYQSQNAKNNSPWGILSCEKNPSFQNQFSQNVRLFLLPSNNAGNYQEFSCRKGIPGGFYISGKVFFKGRGFSVNYPTSNLTVDENNSYIKYHILNSKNENPLSQKDPGMRLDYGTVEGGSFNLVFSDTKGKIVMQNGRVNNGLFVADVSFENSNNTKGNLHTFVISACQFLDCQN